MAIIQHRDTFREICKLQLVDRYTDIDVLVQSINDIGGSFNITGYFLDLDSNDAPGDWYKITITFMKYSDTAMIQFESSYLVDTTQQPNCEYYSDYRRGRIKPSA